MLPISVEGVSGNCFDELLDSGRNRKHLPQNRFRIFCQEEFRVVPADLLEFRHKLIVALQLSESVARGIPFVSVTFFVIYYLIACTFAIVSATRAIPPSRKLNCLTAVSHFRYLFQDLKIAR
jgi:hypothetical protein